jgi:hypothetical protein
VRLAIGLEKPERLIDTAAAIKLPPSVIAGVRVKLVVFQCQLSLDLSIGSDAWFGRGGKKQEQGQHDRDLRPFKKHSRFDCDEVTKDIRRIA